MLSVIKNGFKRVLTGIHGCQMFTDSKKSMSVSIIWLKMPIPLTKPLTIRYHKSAEQMGNGKKFLWTVTIHLPFQLEGDREECVGCKAPLSGKKLKPQASHSYCLCKWRQQASRALLNESIILKVEKWRNLNNLKHTFVTFKKSIRFQKGVHYSSLETILFLIK